MIAFNYYNPTEIIFGRGRHEEVGEQIRKRGGKKVLFHYGGGSIKRSGLYEQICRSLEEAGLSYVELGGVRPNPRVSLVREGIRLCREENVDYVLAVGGGSDSAHLTACGIPTLCALGVRGQFNHTEREWAEEESLFERTKLLMALLSEL